MTSHLFPSRRRRPTHHSALRRRTGTRSPLSGTRTSAAAVEGQKGRSGSSKVAAWPRKRRQWPSATRRSIVSSSIKEAPLGNANNNRLGRATFLCVNIGCDWCQRNTINLPGRLVLSDLSPCQVKYFHLFIAPSRININSTCLRNESIDLKGLPFMMSTK